MLLKIKLKHHVESFISQKIMRMNLTKSFKMMDQRLTLEAGVSL